MEFRKRKGNCINILYVIAHISCNSDKYHVNMLEPNVALSVF